MFFKALNITLVLFILCLFIQGAKGQNSEDNWKKITDYQDLDIGEVYAITADTANLIWMGTSTGLYTYDGFYFDQILDIAVTALKFERNAGNLWIGTKFDLYKLNSKSRVLRKMKLEKKLVSSVEFFFTSIHEDENHGIWASSYNGLYTCKSDSCLNFIVEPNPEKVQKDPYLNRLNQVAPHDHPDSLYIAALKGVYTFNTKSKSFYHTSYSSTIVSHIINRPGKLILSKFKGEIEIHDNENKEAIEIDLPANELITALVYRPDDKLWIGTENGLYSWDGKFTFYQNIAEPLYISKPPKCYTVYEDKFGHLWAGFENGLYMWDSFSMLVSTEVATNILPGLSPVVHEINEVSEQQLLITSNSNDIYKYNTSDRSNEKYLAETDEIILLNDSLWILSKNLQLLSYDPRSRSQQLLLNKSDFKAADLKFYLSHTFDQASNMLLVGLQWGRGLTKVNLQTGEYQKFNQADFFDKDQFTTTGFSYLTIENDFVYFTSGKGLGKLSLETGEATLIENEIQTACTGLDSNQKGSIYAVFEKDGLYQIKPEFKKIELEIINLETIFFDEDDDLWASSPTGVSSIDLDSRTYFTLTKANGLPRNNLYGAKLSGGQSGSVHIQLSDWIAWFNKGELKLLDIHNISPVISQLPNHNFRFSSRNYKPKGSTQYEYRLSGLSNTWEKANQLNEVRFNNLTGGKYEFQVRSSFAGKPWKYSDTTNFSIPHPWWKRWYSILGALLLISAAVYFYNRQVRKQEQLKLQLKTMEMQTLRSQMNPHFIFNALNSIKHFILGNDKFIAAEYLSNFSMLIRKILNNSTLESITLSEELETLKLYIEMEQMRFDHQFEYEFHIDENVNPDMVSLPPLILQPYIENAIWHGLLHKEGIGLLKLNVSKKDQIMVYEVEDNGIGRKAAAEIKTKTVLKRKSLGMQITKERLHMTKVNANVEVLDLHQGTKVVIKISEQ